MKQRKVADHSNSIASLSMMASALAGRTLEVKYDEARVGAAWTDGKIVYVTSDGDLKCQLRQVCSQCALLASGSLDRDIIKHFIRKPKLLDRYLALESKRALKELSHLLPPSYPVEEYSRSIPDSESSYNSLEIALSKADIGLAPASFGTICPREILAAVAQEGGSASAGKHTPRSQQSEPMKELSDEANDHEDDNAHDFSSPVGGGGGIGKLLQKMFKMVRDVKGGGSPGADAPTHWSRTGSRAGAKAVRSSAQPETIEDAFGKHAGIHYPEWDTHRQCYRLDWCTVQEIDTPIESHADVEWLGGIGLRKPITRLGMGLDRFHRQIQGDDIDLDAAIESWVEQAAGSAPDEYCYVESQRNRRDLSVLVLLDISGSVSQASTSGRSVHEQQRSVGAELITVLYEVGDRVALYAFHSQGRGAVHLAPVKRFEDNLDSQVMNRLYSLKPGAYSRLGAAIRHGTTELIDHGGTTRKLLLVLSDGLAYDHGYEPTYAAADVRKALGEARRDGVGCLCVSVGADTETETLRRVFGSAAHATIPHPNQLGREIGRLFRSALQSAESQRRIA